MAQVTAKLNNLRMAPRKVRAVSNLIKNKNVLDALNQLDTMIKRPSVPMTKLVKSAIANAENSHNMVKENLYVKSIKVDEGVKLKRFKPKGFGRVSPIEKKTSHISLILAEKVPGLRRTLANKKLKEEKEKTMPSTQKTEEKRESKKPEVKTKLGRKERIFSGIGKRIFRRKSI